MPGQYGRQGAKGKGTGGFGCRQYYRQPPVPAFLQPQSVDAVYTSPTPAAEPPPAGTTEPQGRKKRKTP
jgi:hypothetical protein